MPRRTTLFLLGGHYHIYNRGANKVTLFRSEPDYLYALSLLKTYSRKLQISVLAYCFLPNHYHWLLRQDADAPAGLLPQRIFNIYSHVMHNVAHHSGPYSKAPTTSSKLTVTSTSATFAVTSTPIPSATA